MSNNRRGDKLSFTREICLGDVIQILIIGCSAIWFFAHMDSKIQMSFDELDDLHKNVGEMRTDIKDVHANVNTIRNELDVMKMHVADMLDRKP